MFAAMCRASSVVSKLAAGSAIGQSHNQFKSRLDAKLIALLCCHPNFASDWQGRARSQMCYFGTLFWFTRFDLVADQP